MKPTAFLGGSLAEADQNNGTWQSGILGIWQAFLDAIPREPDIAPALSTSTADWCVYSRTQRAANLVLGAEGKRLTYKSRGVAGAA